MNHYNTKAIINGFNFMLDVCENQQQVFYRYYSEAEMKEDQTLEACGLFFIPGEKMHLLLLWYRRRLYCCDVLLGRDFRWHKSFMKKDIMYLFFNTG